MSTATMLHPNENGEAVDQREYRSMIGPLLYLKETRSDIQFDVYMLSSFPTLFTSDIHSANLQVSQTNSWVWDLIFYFFFARSCWLFAC
jgi:hypothetical protein